MRAENSFTVRLGRIHAPSGSKKFVSLAGQVRRAARRFGRASYSRRSSKAVSYYQRRVIVKVSLVKMAGKGAARQAAHVDYIGRDSAAPDREKADGLLRDPGGLYDWDGWLENGDDFVARTKDDPHQFRIIVSPEDSIKMTDLPAFTRDFMREMEKTLARDLNWVAAAHYDTATPHVHIVLSGRDRTGKCLILPRDYIARGMRMQAERLVTLELGPMRVLEAEEKLARQVRQERLTGLDRGLLRAAQENIVDVGSVPKAGEAWTRRLDIARLKFLSKMGLAEKLTNQSWRLADDMEDTLKSLGERGDIIKAYHRAMGQSEDQERDLGSVIYNPGQGDPTKLIGRVRAKGILDDVYDRSYVILDRLDGCTIFVKMGNANQIENLAKGQIIELTSRMFKARPSDHTIAKIAARNGRIYSLAFHNQLDPGASPDYLEAHVRRLEALRRAGLVTRRQDGSWKVPGDYLERVGNYEARRGKGQPFDQRIVSKAPLKKLSQTIGRTWLDEQLIDQDAKLSDKGFGGEVKEALKARRVFLVRSEILLKQTETITKDHLDALEARDLQDAGEKLSTRLGKDYAPMPNSGRIDGTLVDDLERPSGRYAIVERAKDFTLVPWRDVLERRRGMEILGQVRNGRTNWQLSRQRGLGIS